MRIQFHDVIIRQREAELPSSCSRCGKPLQAEGSLLLCEYPRQSSRGQWEGEGQITIRDVHFGPESRRLRTQVACSECGKLLVDGAEVWLSPEKCPAVEAEFLALIEAMRPAGYLPLDELTPPATAPLPSAGTTPETSSSRTALPWLGGPIEEDWPPVTVREALTAKLSSQPITKLRLSWWQRIRGWRLRR